MTNVKIEKAESEWREQLDDDSYRVLREKGTELAFTGEYHDCKQVGEYLCKGCGAQLFSSATKYDSGSGWPSFYQPANAQCITEHNDSTHGMTRVEVVCSRCDSHLGHVFPDGPQPTGLRYCINSLSLDLKPEA